MKGPLERRGDAARILLASIRLVNGTGGWLAPRFAARKRLGVDTEIQPAAIYPLRLFGVRTVVMAAELLARDRNVRRAALDAAVLIHASDTLAALLCGLRRELPRRQATILTVTSAANVALALVARSGARA